MNDADSPNAIVPYSSSHLKPKTLPQRLKFMIRETGDILEVPADVQLIIGRKSSQKSVDVDLTPFHAIELGISRHHVGIQPTKDRLMVRDLNSVNGTLLNREPMTPLHVYQLQHGDELKLGRMHIKVYFVD